MKQFVPVTPLGGLIIAHREELLAAAARRHARELRLLSSVALGEDSADSDVDLLVQPDPLLGPLTCCRWPATPRRSSARASLELLGVVTIALGEGTR